MLVRSGLGLLGHQSAHVHHHPWGGGGVGDDELTPVERRLYTPCMMIKAPWLLILGG